jgi:hypothetical protein
MTVLFRWTPARFVEEHEEDVSLLFRIDFVKLLVQTIEMKEALGHEVILNALVLKVSIHGLNELQVRKRETDQFIWCFILIQSDY